MSEKYWDEQEKREEACYDLDLKVRKSVEEMKIVLEKADFSEALQKKLGREPTEDEIRLFVQFLNISLYPPFALSEEAEIFIKKIIKKGEYGK